MSFLRGFSSVFAEFVNQRENKNGIYLYVLGLLFMISVLCSIHPIQWCQKQIKGGRARLIKILTSQKKEGLLVNRPPPLPVSTPMPLNLRLSQLMYPHSYDE